MEVELHNFRCHHDATFRFNLGHIHLINGDSGEGKTTILKSIYWCLYGKETGVSPNDLDPKEKAKTKTWVRITIEFPSGETRQIYRQTNSRVLNVLVTKLDGNTSKYEDIIAQEYINSWLGPYDMWIASSFLQQKQYHPFITGSGAEKLALITQLAFQNNNPKEYISRVESEIKSNQNNLTEISAQFKVRLQLYEDKLNKYNIDPDSLSLDDNFDPVEARETINALNEELKEFDLLERDFNTYVQSLNNLLRSISERERDPEYLSSQLEDIRVEMEVRRVYDSYQTNKKLYASYCKRKDDLMDRINRLPPVPIDPGTRPIRQWTQREITALQTQINEYNSNLEIVKGYNIGYSKDSIDEYLTRLDSELEAAETELKSITNQVELKKSWDSRNKRLKSLIEKRDADEKTLSQLEAEISSTEAELTGLSDSSKEIALLERDLLDIKNKKGSLFTDEYWSINDALKNPPLECPGCGCGLRYQSSRGKGSLVAVENIVVSTLQSRLKEIEDNISNIEKDKRHSIEHLGKSTTQYLSLKKKIDALNRKADSVDEGLMKADKDIEILKTELGPDPGIVIDETSGPSDPSDIRRLNRDISILERVKIVSLPDTTPEEALNDNKIYQRIELEKEMEKLKSEEPEAPPTSELDDYKFKYSSINAAQRERDRLVGILNKLEKVNELESQVSDVKSKMKAINVSSLERDIDELNEKIIRYQLTQELIKERDSLVPLRENVISIQTKIADLGRLKQLMIDAEYASYEKVSEAINTDLATIVKPMFKETIDVKISMFKSLKTKDRIKPVVNLLVFFNEREMDIKQMSEGQKERISLALALTMSSMNHSPMMLLDETFGTLSEADRERVIDVLSFYRDSNSAGELDRMFICVNQVGSTGWYDSTLTIGK